MAEAPSAVTGSERETPQQHARRTRPRHLRFDRWYVLPLVALLALVTWRAFDDPVLYGDSHELAIGAEGVVNCLRHGPLTNCDRRSDGLITGASPSGFVYGHVAEYPPLQYVVAVPLRAAGVSATTTLRVLIVFEAAAVNALVILVWIIAMRRGRVVWAPLLALVIVTGPLLWFATSAFGEALACLTITAMVGALLTSKRPWLIAVLVALACMTKETNPPFILALAALSLAVVRPPSAESRRRTIVAVLGGAVLGVAIDAAFNVFRWNSPLNQSYLEHPFRTPNVATGLRSFLALWFAPNGGLVWFWPLMIGAMALTLAATRRSGHGNAHASVVWIAAALMVAEVAVLAAWYSPFGWIAWGPRLALPLLPGIVLVAVVAAGDAGDRTAGTVLSNRAGLAIVGLVGAASAIAQTAIVWRPEAIGNFFHSSAPCLTHPHAGAGSSAYYRCVFHSAWHAHPILLQGLGGATTAVGSVATVLAVLTVGGLLAAARARGDGQTVSPARDRGERFRR